MNNPDNPMMSDPNTPGNPLHHPPVVTNGVQIKPFESGHTRALFTMIFLASGILLDGVSMVSEFMQINLLSDAARGLTITTEVAESNDSRVALIALVKFLNYLVTAIGFLMWFHRAHRNLPALGARIWNIRRAGRLAGSSFLFSTSFVPTKLPKRFGRLAVLKLAYRMGCPGSMPHPPPCWVSGGEPGLLQTYWGI
jgi:hypothetical protein